MSPSPRLELRPSRSGPWAAFISTLALLAITTAPVHAQSVTRSLATSLTVDAALVGAAEQDLEFSRIQPGTNKTVAAQAGQTCVDGCAPGRWRFQNISSRGADRYASLQWTVLPDSLTGPGGAKLGVSYNAQACVYNRATNAAVGCVSQASSTQGSTLLVPINKVAGAIGDQKPAMNRDLYLWLGGTASPRPNQRAGHYAGVVTVFFFYQ